MLDMGKISCSESAMEEKGFELDADACDDLEDAYAFGSGNIAALWKSCQAEAKFDEAAREAVASKSF